MDKLFLTILNMSLTGAFVISVICLVRPLLKKAPKIIYYCLWAVAGFRLIFPFSIESVFSLIPFNAQIIPTDIAVQPVPRIDSGIRFLNNAVSSLLPAAEPSASANPLQPWIVAGAIAWLIGACAMAVYGVVSFAILERKMREASHIEANIYESRQIKSPFVLGVFRPRIYIPVGLSEKEKEYVLLHERTHIRRRDHIIKIAAYLILCLHWFNPLVWAAFLLMGADMEMSCDERVLKEMGNETKKDYSMTLLSLATDKRVIGGSPLAFGEGGIKERIKNVLDFKKPSRVVIILSVALAAALSIGFAANWANNAVNNAANRQSPDRYGFPGEKTMPIEGQVRIYFLENATDREIFERLSSITLYSDGTVGLGIPPISSYFPPRCTYNFSDGELLICASIESKQAENAFGVPNGEVIARFEIIDDKTLMFRSASVPLFADEGARYVCIPAGSIVTPFDAVIKYREPGGKASGSGAPDGETSGSDKPDDEVSGSETPDGETVGGKVPDGMASDGMVTDGKALCGRANKWLDYYFDEKMPWDGGLELELAEFPGVVFRWTPYDVKAIDSSGEMILIKGMPVWNVYIADLTGDGLPEFCATVSIGSGIVDQRIIVCDYSTGNVYELSDRMRYDYVLYPDNGRLMVKQIKYPSPQGDVLATGELAIVDGQLVMKQ